MQQYFYWLVLDFTNLYLIYKNILTNNLITQLPVNEFSKQFGKYSLINYLFLCTCRKGETKIKVNWTNSLSSFKFFHIHPPFLKHCIYSLCSFDFLSYTHSLWSNFKIWWLTSFNFFYNYKILINIKY